MQHQLALLLDRFGLHKTHCRRPHCLADRLGMGGIVLVAKDLKAYVKLQITAIGLDIYNSEVQV